MNGSDLEYAATHKQVKVWRSPQCGWVVLHGTMGMGCAHGTIDGHTCGVYKIATVNDGRGL